MLEEASKLKELQDTLIPNRRNEIKEILEGGDVDIDVAWESFQDLNEINCMDFQTFHKLNMALRGMNAMKKKKCREGGLKVVRVVNTTDPKNKKLSYDQASGELTICAC